MAFFYENARLKDKEVVHFINCKDDSESALFRIPDATARQANELMSATGTTCSIQNTRYVRFVFTDISGEVRARLFELYEGLPPRQCEDSKEVDHLLAALKENDQKPLFSKERLDMSWKGVANRIVDHEQVKRLIEQQP